MKKKNSAKRRLLSAAGMLAISAAMLSSATFAWFSMNKEAKVASMSISAKSADPIIEISANGTTFYNELSTTVTATVTTPNWSLPNATNAALKLVTPTAISTASESIGNVSWGWASSTAHDNAQVSNTTTAKALVSQSTPAPTENNRAAYLGIENDALYVLTQKLTIRNVSADVNATNLQIKEVNINKGTNTIGNAARVLFVAADGKYALYEPSSTGNTATLVSNHQWLDSASNAPATDMGTTSGGKPIIISQLNAKGTNSSTFAAGSSTEVDVYVFFDGTDEDAYTDLATDLSDVKIDFTFAID